MNKIEKHVTLAVDWWGWVLDDENEFGDFDYINRIDGPAVIERNTGHKTFWLLNKKVTEEDYYTPGFIDSFILEHS